MSESGKLAIFLLAIAAGIAALLMGFLVPWATTLYPQLAGDDFTKVEALDLLAQQHMAAAAWAMAFLTFCSLALGGITLYYLKRNLDETQAMRIETARSAHAAEIAAEATEQATIVAEQVGRAQVRAYVTITGVELETGVAGGAFDAIRIQYRNAGQSPARTATITLQLQVLGANDSISLLMPNWRTLLDDTHTAALLDLPAQSDGQHPWTLLAGHRQPQPRGGASMLPLMGMLSGVFPPPENSVPWDNLRFIASGDLSFEDVFGELFSEPFRFSLDVLGNVQDGQVLTLNSQPRAI